MNNVFVVYARLAGALAATHNYLLNRHERVYKKSNAYKTNLAIMAEKFIPVIDMILFCPACCLQHVDASEPAAQPSGFPVWSNPPHRSHLCAGCGYQWRPADVCTNGVAAIQTKEKNDSPSPIPDFELRATFTR